MRGGTSGSEHAAAEDGAECVDANGSCAGPGGERKGTGQRAGQMQAAIRWLVVPKSRHVSADCAFADVGSTRDGALARAKSSRGRTRPSISYQCQRARKRNVRAGKETACDTRLRRGRGARGRTPRRQRRKRDAEDECQAGASRCDQRIQNDEARWQDGHQRMDQRGEREQKDGAGPGAVDAGGNGHQARGVEKERAVT